MTVGFLVFSNLIAPVVTGLFLSLFFVYFVVTSRSKAPSFKYYLTFILSFGLFSIGRPLQLLLGSYPMPLIIVNIRVFVLCAVITPAVALATDVFHKRDRSLRMLLIVVPCVVLGGVYDLFNTLGTHGSYVAFQYGGIVAHDNLTPQLLPPFYGREVTLAVQFLVAVILLLFSSLALVRLRVHATFRDRLTDKRFLINNGILVFAVSFIVGSLTEQWWIYYSASILSDLLIGAGVLLDAREVHWHYQKLIPFVREDIAHNVAFSEFSRTKLVELLKCLGKKVDLDRFVVLKLKVRPGDTAAAVAMMDSLIEIAHVSFTRLFGSGLFVLLPLANARVGVILKSPDELGDGRENRLLECLEEVREEIIRTCGGVPLFGVGQRCDGIESLWISYRGALSALDYAEQFNESTIIHVNDLDPREQQAAAYPAREKEKLLHQIRLGDVDGVRAAMGAFAEKFQPYIELSPELLMVRLYELMASFVDSAALGGGDEEQLDRLTRKYTRDIDRIGDSVAAREWIGQVAVETAQTVTHVRERRTNSLVSRAMTYVNANYSSPLSYKDVAREMGISPSYFTNLFKKEMGITFVDYLTEVRINAAKNLLLTTDLAITQIAFDVGFNSSSYFSSIFHRLVGRSAKEYRERQLADESAASAADSGSSPGHPSVSSAT